MLERGVTAPSASAAFRPCSRASARTSARASLMILLRRSLPRFEPLDEIGIAEPAFVVGESAATSAACMITKPALAARAPSGQT